MTLNELCQTIREKYYTLTSSEAVALNRELLQLLEQHPRECVNCASGPITREEGDAIIRGVASGGLRASPEDQKKAQDYLKDHPECR